MVLGGIFLGKCLGDEVRLFMIGIRIRTLTKEVSENSKD
jgi:hypothetical protein